MKAISLIIGVLIILTCNSCDPMSCRDCGTIEYDIRQWSLSDHNEIALLTFEDQNQTQFLFNLLSVEFSEPYNKCEISSTPEGVACLLTKTLIYASNDLNLELRIVYNQFKDLVSTDVTLINYGFKRSEENLFTDISQPLYWPTSQELIDLVLTELDSFAVGSYQYDKVLNFNPRFMVDPNTMEEIEPRYIESLYFKPSIGLVGIETTDNGNIILVQ